MSDSTTVVIIGQGPVVSVTHANNVCPGDSIPITSNIISLQCGIASEPCGSPSTIEYGISTAILNGTPFIGSNEDARTQILYRASDLLAAGLSAGTINGIAFLVGSKASTAPYQNFQMRIGCTSASSLSPTTWVGGTTVVLGPSSFSTSLFWNALNFTTPYDWDGLSNLVVELCYDNPTGSGPGGIDDLFQNTVSYTGTIRNYTNGTVGCSLTGPAFSSAVVPNTQFYACPGSGANLTYSWTPVTGLNDPNSSNPVAHVTEDITYTFTVSDTVCSTDVIVQIDVDSNYALVASADTMIEAGDSVQIFANTTGSPPVNQLNCGDINTNCSTGTMNYDLGTATTFYTGGVTHPSPYGHYYEGGKHQMLYRASELQAAGVTSGTITELALNIANLMGTSQYCDWTISMGCTADTVLTGWITGLTTVHDPAVINIALGWNTHTFDRSFDWDGDLISAAATRVRVGHNYGVGCGGGG